MFFQLVLDILIFIGVVYLIYRLLFKDMLEKRKESKRLLKEEKLQQLKEKEIDLQKEVIITEDLIDVETDVKKLNKELRKLDSKILEE